MKLDFREKQKQKSRAEREGMRKGCFHDKKHWCQNCVGKGIQDQEYIESISHAVPRKRLKDFISSLLKNKDKEIMEELKELCLRKISDASGNGLWTSGMENLYYDTIEPFINAINKK